MKRRQNYIEGLALVAGCATSDVLRCADDRDGFRRTV